MTKKWTKEKIIEKLREIWQKEQETGKKFITSKDIRKYKVPGLEYWAINIFGGTRGALIAAGIPHSEHRIEVESSEETIKKVQELAKKLGKRTFTVKDLRKYGISEYPIRKHFGGMANFLRAAGLEPSTLAKGMAATNEELLQELYELGEKLGRRPGQKDINEHSKYSEAIYRSRFGSNVKAWEIIQKKKEETKESKEPREEDKAIKVEPKKKESLFQTSNLYVGTAAEYLVISELLLRNFNANLLPIDSGIDIFATRGDSVYNIQVKHIWFQNKSGSSDITISSFERNQAGNVFYIFVLRTKEKTDFLILPYYKVAEFLDRGIIYKQNEEAKKYNVNVREANGKIYINEISDRAEVTSYLNRWNSLI